MKAADPDLNAAFAERPGKVECPRKLVGLNADEHHHAVIGSLDERRHPVDVDDGVGFVKGVDVEINALAEYLIAGTFERQAVKSGKRIRRYRRTIPLDHIAVVVIVRRLDQN